MKEYTYHTDAGHGWLEVPYAELRSAGLHMSQISGFSYAQVTDQHVPTLYLEEDCDMPLFLNALKTKGVEFKLNEKYHGMDAPMRGYSRVA